MHPQVTSACKKKSALICIEDLIFIMFTFYYWVAFTIVIYMYDMY